MQMMLRAVPRAPPSRRPRRRRRCPRRWPRSRAHAAAGIGCDPIVVLSNGLTVQMTATIGVSSASQIGTINWTLYGRSARAWSA